jgi:ubiquinone/menaquinone biosynthesis C-methylase UbiE
MHELATAPNHHALHGSFHGARGLAVAMTLLVGRSKDARLACELADVRPGAHVVDVGCGPGVAVREAMRRDARATGVDPAPVMLRIARSLTHDRRATWLDGTAEALPIADGDASIVWSLATVHHWRDVEQGLAEAHRVLTPGGRFLAIERARRPEATGHASHGWTDDQAEAFATVCRVAGFTDVAVARHRVRSGTLLSVVGVRA